MNRRSLVMNALHVCTGISREPRVDFNFQVSKLLGKTYSAFGRIVV